MRPIVGDPVRGHGLGLPGPGYAGGPRAPRNIKGYPCQMRFQPFPLPKRFAPGVARFKFGYGKLLCFMLLGSYVSCFVSTLLVVMFCLHARACT